MKLHLSLRFVACCLAPLLLLGTLFVARSTAQEEELPEPLIDSLQTKDGLNLKYVFYPGTKGKATVPVLLLHGFGGNRNDYASLAKHLQQQGHAVLVPDLRGHGGSTKFADGRVFRVPPEMKESEKAATYAAVFGGMMQDVEGCKKFLLDQHNDGQLNIELLCLVAAEESTVIALNWAVADWNAKSVPAFKQGQDVKALVLLSPVSKIEKTAFSTINSLKTPIVGRGLPNGMRLSILIAVGDAEPRANTEAKKLNDPLKRARPEPADKDKDKNLDLFFVPCDTTLQGTKLFNPRVKPNLEEFIARFIELRLVKKQNVFTKWEDRKNPF